MGIVHSRLLVALVAGSLLFSGNLHAQTSPYIPKIIPPSPEGAALFKFTDVPVSPYTGTTDISVPIYTIQAKGISIPVNIDYHTGGIRLKEESGLVGLGWMLNAGGSIARTVMDKDDFNASDYFTTDIPQPQGDLSFSQPSQFYPTPGFGITIPDLGIYMFDFFCNNQVNFSTGTVSYSNAFTTIGESSYDMEPDIYSYNFGGHNGKFMITRNRQVILQKQENIRVQFENNGNSFTITDDQGNIFYFADKAYSQSASLLSSPISSWNLSKIVTAQKDSVLFNYYSDPTAEYVGPDYYDTYTAYSGGFGTDGFNHLNGAGTFYGNELLQSVDFTNGRLQFYYDNARSDLLGGKKLDTIKIFSRTESGFQYKKEFDFFYSYFDNTSVPIDSLEKKRLRLDSVKEASGNLSIPPYAFTYNVPANIGSLAKHGYGIDHWGYFNAASNTTFIPTTSLFFNPPVSGVPTVPDYFTYSAADREPNANYTQAFSLAQVRYPTGGKTVLEYEPNDYDAVHSRNGPQDFPSFKVVTVQKQIFSQKRGDTTGTIDLSRIYPLLASNSSQINFTLSLTFRASDNTGLQNSRNSYGQIQFGFSGDGVNFVQDITGSNLNCGGPVCTVVLPISIHASPTNIYTWDAYINPGVSINDFQDIRVTFQYDTAQLAGEPAGPGVNNYAITAGGLRIKTVTDYSNDNSIAKKRRFDYNYTNYLGESSANYSYGKLMSPPSYARYANMANSFGSVNALVITGSSYTPISSSISGNIVGYDQVNEYTIDPVTNLDIGKTVYTFFNSPDSGALYHGFRFPGTFNMGNNLNGSILSKTEYANVGGIYKKVSATNYNYHTANRMVYFSPKYQATGQTGQSGSPYQGICTVGDGAQDETIACFYPSLKSERVLLDSTTQVTYDQGDTLKYMVTAKRNFYDNPVHYQLTRSRVVDSKSNSLVSLIKYPQDYLSGGAWTSNTVLDSLIGRNMVSEVIEKRDSLYYPGSSSGYVTGAELSRYRMLSTNVLRLDKQFKLNVRGPVSDFQGFSFSGNTLTQDSRYRQMISMDSYDESNNINQFTFTDLVPKSFIWDYTHTYPIAKVENAAISASAYTSFEADGAGNWTIGSTSRDTTAGITGRNSYLLNSDISKSGLNNSTTYIVSYWTQNGSPFTISGTIANYPVKGKTVNGWTFYMHRVTGQTTISIGGSGHIDELRLYPANAQMTTYTYTPLVGMTSQCDVNNRITYYEYDGLQRLKRVRDQDYNILKTLDYQYQAASGCGSGCYILPMQTMSGTNTLSYPVGVFNVKDSLLGNATNQAGYISLWNADTANSHRGTLAAGSDSMHFQLALNTGKALPSLTGCRYYQYDLRYSYIDAIRNANGCYVDFGDSTGMRMGKTLYDTVGVVPARNTLLYLIPYPYYVHTYADTSLRTITFYHTDGGEHSYLDNVFSPATSLSKLKNLRGYCPQNTTGIGGSCYQNASALTVAGLINWSSISSAGFWVMNPGDGATAAVNLSYAQDFMKNNKGLNSIFATREDYYAAGFRDSSFKISRLKSDWNTYFTGIISIQINDEQWNREDLSALKKLSKLLVVAGNQHHSNDQTNNPVTPLPQPVVDSILIQVAAGAGQNVNNGIIKIMAGGTIRSSVSDAALALLLSKGWTILINGVNLNTN